jgi:hypothetical protein
MQFSWMRLLTLGQLPIDGRAARTSSAGGWPGSGWHESPEGGPAAGS